jgi:hypothetical protein
VDFDLFHDISWKREKLSDTFNLHGSFLPVLVSGWF